MGKCYPKSTLAPGIIYITAGMQQDLNIAEGVVRFVFDLSAQIILSLAGKADKQYIQYDWQALQLEWFELQGKGYT
jgi:hypothetical protein